MKDLKEALEVVIKVMEKADDSLADGNISITEGFSLALSALGFVSVVKNFDAIYEEFDALTDEEAEELTVWFAEEFDLNNDMAEGIIEGLFSILLNLSETLELLKRKKK